MQKIQYCFLLFILVANQAFGQNHQNIESLSLFTPTKLLNAVLKENIIFFELVEKTRSSSELVEKEK